MIKTTFGRSVFATRAFLAVLALIVTLAMPVGATIITPGSSGIVPGSADGDPLGILVASMATPFVAPTFTGSLSAYVYDLPGGLMFIYQLTNDGGSPHPIGRFTVNGFDSMFTVDVRQRSDMGGVQPHSVAGRGLFGTLDWNYSGGSETDMLNPGEVSWRAVAMTNAAWYTIVTGSAIDGSSVNFETLGPDPKAGVVPEPSTMVLLGSALVGLAFYRRQGKADSKRGD